MINMYSGNSVIANLLMRFPILIPIAAAGGIGFGAIHVMAEPVATQVVATPVIKEIKVTQQASTELVMLPVKDDTKLAKR